jgi:predicted amidohydrolase YtcJ
LGLVDTRAQPAPLLIRGAEVTGFDGPIDVRLAGGRIRETAPSLTRAAREDVLDALGGQLLPGLHDHHVHLRALAAAGSSIRVGPPDVQNVTRFASALRSEDRRQPTGRWIRAVGYHESVAGDLDRRSLDAIVADRPVRVQHRSGMLWTLNSAGLRTIDADRDAPPGLELDADARPTGRIWREDEWLRQRLPPGPVDLASVSATAAASGITGFTDATPNASESAVRDLARARAEGALVQRLHVMTAPGVEPSDLDGVTVGPVKYLLDDDRLPTLPELAAQILHSHRSGRTVAVHCVTRVQLALAVAVLQEVGTVAGDRIEHGAVVGPDVFPILLRLGLTVVTQPGFVHSRGDRYLDDVEEEDQPDLWRLGSLLASGVRVAAGSDAPFGPFDPWVAIRAAVDRRTAGGRSLGRSERVSLGTAVGLFAGTAQSPASPRTIKPGQPADLCLLSEPLVTLPGSPAVVATIVAGLVVHRLGDR